MPRLMRYAMALLRDRREAEDLVHDVIARALANIGSWREGDSPRRWLFTIMHNLNIDQRRARARRPAEISLEDLAAPEAGLAPSDEVTRREIEAALAALPLEQRQCVLLVGLEGLTYAEASDVLAVPVGTVMSRLCRGRERLRELLDHQSVRSGTGTLRRVK